MDPITMSNVDWNKLHAIVNDTPISLDAVRKLSEEECNNALLIAAWNGNVEAVYSLISTCMPIQKESMALIYAADRGHLDVVRQLLDIVDVKHRDSMALCCATRHGYLEIVRLLIKECDVFADNFLALRLAARHGHAEVLAILAGADAEHILRTQIDQVLQSEQEDGLPLIDMLCTHVDSTARLHAVQALLPRWLGRLPNFENWHHTEQMRLADLASAERQRLEWESFLPPAKARVRPNPL